MPDLANNEHVQRQAQYVCDRGRNDHPAARQSQHQVSPNPLVLQATPQLQPGIVA
jgi:hypothetical protein